MIGALTGNDNLGIGDLSHGISSTGFSGYVEKLRTEVIGETTQKLLQVEEIVRTLDGCWQGVSKTRFQAQFATTIAKIEADLIKEQIDLENRLMELRSNYFSQDANMMDENE